MKTMHKILATAGIGLTMVAMAGCSADFLDREPTGHLTPGAIENSQWNANLMLGLSSATTRTLFVPGSTGGSQDDFGQKAYDIITDMYSGDNAMARNSYGWFYADLIMQSGVSTGSHASQLWNYNYNMIYQANGLLTTVTGGDLWTEPEDYENKFYYAVARTMRAYSYFNLVTLYGRSWSEAPNQKVCPLVMSQGSDGVPVPGATVTQVYDTIVADLTAAITAYDNAASVGYSRSDVSQPEGNVARIILAEVLLQRGNEAAGDYARAKELALEAVNYSGCAVLPYDQVLTTGFNTVNTSNWLWGVDVTSASSGGLASFWGMMDMFTYGYADVGDVHGINSYLYDQIPASDARKNWFLSPEDATTLGLGSSYAYAPWNKFYDGDRELGGDRTWVNDLCFMRQEEGVLAAAEAAVRSNDLATARQMLKLLLDQRDPAKSAQVDQMDQTQLLDELFYEWRVEMWGEGRSLNTMKRFKRSIQRSAVSYYLPSVVVNYDDDRLYFATPQSVLQNNPDMRQ